MAGSKFSVATFNLYQFAVPGMHWYAKTRDDKGNFISTNDPALHWEPKIQFLKHLIGQMKPDIIGFQEVFSAAKLEETMKELGYPYFATAGVPQVSPSDPEVFVAPIVALASKFEITRSTCLRGQPALIPDAILSPGVAFERMIIEAEIRVDGLQKPLVVYVAHLKSQGARVDKMVVDAADGFEAKYQVFMRGRALSSAHQMIQRTAEAAMLRDHVAERIAQSPDQGFVILGDLNEAPTGIMFEILSQGEAVDVDDLNIPKDQETQAKQNVHKFRLYDTRNLLPADVGAYPPTKKGSTRYAPSTIDYIFVSNSLSPRNSARVAEPENVRVFDTHFDFTSDKRTNSDHAAVYTRFKIKG